MTVFLEIPAGETATVVVTYRGRLEPTDGAYTLTVGRQPAVGPGRDRGPVIVGAPGWRLPEDSGGEARVRATTGTARPRGDLRPVNALDLRGACGTIDRTT